MYNFFSEVYRVSYGDLCYLKHNIVQTMVSTLIGPLLYLLAFGYGMRAPGWVPFAGAVTK